jgi:Spy/CpxP family protein refolding chaperone
MRTAVLAAAAAVTLAANLTFAQAPVRDWHDLDAVHEHVVEAINEMDRARAANHYDMAGHGAKAEEALHRAERELREAIRAAREGR